MAITTHLLLLSLDLAISLVILGVYYQAQYQILTLLRFKRKPSQDTPLTTRPRWLSTQPAPNPDSIPTLFAQALGPFPMTPLGGDWNYFCYVHLDQGADTAVALRGQMNDCRISNLTLYLPEHLQGTASSPPPCLDATEIEATTDGRYEVRIGPRVTGTNALVTPVGARHAILAFRNYVFSDRSSIHYPAVYWCERLIVPAKTVSGVRSALLGLDDPSDAVAKPTAIALERS